LSAFPLLMGYFSKSRGVCRSDEDCSSRHTTEDRMTMFEFPQERKVYATTF
jgi:hypothetical protein